MDLKELFTKEGRARAALRRRIAKATDKWRMGEDRMKALEELRALGTTEAIAGLLRRFDVVADKLIEDEHEKEWVFTTLVELGPERVLPPLRRALRSAPSISWKLRLAEKLLDHEALWELLAQTLEAMEPGYERDPTRKIQMLLFFADWRDRRVTAAVIPYLKDMDEGVRFTAVETLARHHDEAAREPLLALLVDEHEESRRVKVRICEILADQGWTVHGFRGAVEKLLPEAFTLDRDGHVKRKKAT